MAGLESHNKCCRWDSQSCPIGGCQGANGGLCHVRHSSSVVLQRMAVVRQHCLVGRDSDQYDEQRRSRCGVDCELGHK